MSRTIISLDDEDKAWLAEHARHENVPMTEIVRRAIRRMRDEERTQEAFSAALRDTSGIWPQGDGLAYQQAMRDEWKGRA